MTWIVLLWLAQDSESERINRRSEAQGAFLSTPSGLYGRYCAHCHGEDGKGGGRLWATDLPARPADLTASALDEPALVRLITEGSGKLCPPWGRTISRENVERLARHIASFRGEIGPPKPPSPAPVAPSRARIPWLLIGVILLEIALLGRALLKRRECRDAVSQDPPVRG